MMISLWPGRLFRIELRRNATWVLLPLLAALIWLASPYGRTLKAPVVLWSSRSLAMQGMLQVLGPFAAGMAAWMASREARRQLTDLVASTPRSRFSRRLAVLGAAACWVLALYAAAGVVLFALTAPEASWGGPVWWPVAVGAVGVPAFTAFGFACGAVLPGRFTAPLLGAGLLLLLQVGLALHSTYSSVSPVRDSINQGASVFFGVNPALAIAQIIFLSGVTLTALGVTAAPSASRISAPLAVGVAGILLAGTGVGLVRPAVHGTAGSRPVGYLPVCDDSAPIPVCVHPAYRSLLPAMAADLAPLTSQVAGLPGAPVRTETAAPQARASWVGGRPPVLYLGQFVNTAGPMTADQLTQTLLGQAARAICGLAPVEELTGAALAKAPSAQLDVALGLEAVAGMRLPPAIPAPVADAARHFAGLPEQVRRGWLGAHLAALRAGQVTPAELP